MVTQRIVATTLSFALCATTASAQSASQTSAEPGASSPAQALYKGVLGNLLEAVPLPAADRTELQRLTSAVSSPFSARSLALALGLASPPLMVIGLVWGLWSASQIRQSGTIAFGDNAAAGPNENTAGLPVSAMVPARHVRSAESERVLLGPQQAVELLERGVRIADSGALSHVVGGAAPDDRVVPCEYCYMPLLYPRAAPDMR
jgi:hypothetical protein